MPDPLYPVPPEDVAAPPPAEISHGLLSDAHYEGRYVLNWIDIHLEHDSGRLQMAVAGDPDATTRLSSRAVKVHSGLTQKIVEFHVRRQKLQPVVPSPLPPDSNHVLRHAILRVSSPAVVEDGTTFEWDVKGRYEFMLLAQEWYEDGVQAAIMPWTTISLSEAVFAVEQFQSGMFG